MRRYARGGGSAMEMILLYTRVVIERVSVTRMSDDKCVRGAMFAMIIRRCRCFAASCRAAITMLLRERYAFVHLLPCPTPLAATQRGESVAYERAMRIWERAAYAREARALRYCWRRRRAGAQRDMLHARDPRREDSSRWRGAHAQRGALQRELRRADGTREAKMARCARQDSAAATRARYAMMRARDACRGAMVTLLLRGRALAAQRATLPRRDVWKSVSVYTRYTRAALCYSASCAARIVIRNRWASARGREGKDNADDSMPRRYSARHIRALPARRCCYDVMLRVICYGRRRCYDKPHDARERAVRSECSF